MSYFPFFIELKDEKGLVVGGGAVAYRRICRLLEFGADLTVVAQAFCGPLDDLAKEYEEGSDMLPGHLRLECRRFCEADVEGNLFVVAATDDDKLHRRILALCQERHILVNLADSHGEEGFCFPSIVKRGELVAGVTSSGRSPMLAARVKKALQMLVPDYFAQMNELLGVLRARAQKEIADQNSRAACLEECLQACLDAGLQGHGLAGQDRIEEIFERYTA